MYRLASICLLLVVSVGSSAEPVAKARAYLQEKFPADKPGAAVAIVFQGRPVLVEGFGLADIEKKTPITSETAFDLASVSKQFTAMAIMMLAERGKLNYDDDVNKWIPTMPTFEGARPFRIRDLLNHTTGLPDYLGVFKGNDDEFANLTCADVPRILKGQKLRFLPGSKFEYSNSNYALLPLVVEKASGQPFSRFVQEQIFKPLQMHHSQVADSVPFNVPKRAVGYSKRLFSDKYNVSRRDGPICGDGNVFTTAGDMVKWDAALRDGKLVRPETLNEAWTAPKLESKKMDYGFGWIILVKDGKKTVSHNGGWAGTRTTITRKIDDQLTVVVLCNDESAQPERVANQLCKLFLVKPAAEESSKDR